MKTNNTNNTNKVNNNVKKEAMKTNENKISKSENKKNVINFLENEFLNVSAIIKVLKENSENKDIKLFREIHNIEKFTPALLYKVNGKFAKLVSYPKKEVSEKSLLNYALNENNQIKKLQFVQKSKQNFIIKEYALKYTKLSIKDFFASIETCEKIEKLEATQKKIQETIKQQEALFKENINILQALEK